MRARPDGAGITWPDITESNAVNTTQIVQADRRLCRAGGDKVAVVSALCLAGIVVGSFASAIAAGAFGKINSDQRTAYLATAVLSFLAALCAGPIIYVRRLYGFFQARPVTLTPEAPAETAPLALAAPLAPLEVPAPGAEDRNNDGYGACV